MNYVAKILTILATFAITSCLSQGTDYFTSTSNGDWNTATTWDTGTVPPSNQTGSNDNITIDNNVSLTGDLSVKTGTVLTVNAGDTLTINGNVDFSNGSTIFVYGVLIVNGNVSNSNNSDNVTVNGTISISGDYDGGTGSSLDGTGNMEIDGSVTTTGDGTVFGSVDDCVENCDNSAGNPLPIELGWFLARSYQDSLVAVEWVSITELNNDYFILEKAGNDTIWVILDTVDGQGTTSTPSLYTVIDTPFLGNETQYYRLSQVDFDGTKKTYNIISYVHISKYSMPRQIVVYPNPTTGEFSVELRGFRNLQVTISIIDKMDIAVCKKTFWPKTDKLETVFSKDLENGIYLIVGMTNNNEEIYTKKIMISNNKNK